MRLRSLIARVVIILGILAIGSSSLAHAQTLALQGDHFAVNGKGKFLLFVSYFDAMHASTTALESDFAYLKSKGFDGIRIMPNWRYTCAGVGSDANAQLFTQAGVVTIGNTPWNRFIDILVRAGNHQLLVDVTFTRETYDSFIPIGAYKTAIGTVTTALDNGYDHVLFDVQNEFKRFSQNGDFLEDKAQEIVAYVRELDSSRIVTASTSGISGVEAGTFARAYGMDVVAHHEFRNSDWYMSSALSTVLDDVRSGLAPVKKPIYLQEPMPFAPISGCGDPSDSGPGHARDAAKFAKLHGAAAWTFHTRQSFRLAGTTLQAALAGAQLTELEAIRASVDSIPDNEWGVTSPVRFTTSDFDRDQRSDLVLFRPTTGIWHTRYWTGNTTGPQWGSGADVPVRGDFEGDGKADLAVFRPSQSGSGTWFIKYSSGKPDLGFAWGNSADVLTPGDYDGDGLTDIAVFRQSEGIWYIRYSGTGITNGVQFGGGGGADVPVPGDYDKDGTTDFAVFRPSDGVWYLRYSSTGVTHGFQWGNGADIPVPGDYDGDQIADLAVFRPGDGTWYIYHWGTALTTGVQWGNAADIVAPGDYNGDGKTDMGVFRPSDPTGGTWYIRHSGSGTTVGIQWGSAGDIPLTMAPRPKNPPQ